MKQRSPLRHISIGLILLLIGAILPFCMVIGFLESSFALSFVAYASSLVGLILGLSGAVRYAFSRRQGRN